jgi:EAL domain-containing protein (putative c-di-GMP-specific phosphodiesterase class I)
MNSPAKSHTLVFCLTGLDPLEAVMGCAATRSRLDALAQGITTLVAEVLRDEKAAAFGGDLPRGVWAVRFNSPSRAADAQADKLDAIHTAATALVLELANEVFGSATARLAGLRVMHLPGTPAAGELTALLNVPPPAEDLIAEQALRDALHQNTLRTFLQPIVSFPAGEILGYEALTRGPAGSAVERADRLFATATRCGLTAQVEVACARAALQWADRLPHSKWMSINTSPLSLANTALRQELSRPDIVVEITEHLPLTDARGLLPWLAPMRARGAWLSLDDTGCGYTDMQAAQALRPDFVKLCITIIKSVTRDPDSVLTELHKTITYLKALGIGVLAEGVETQREAELLSTLAIDYAQGWLYGKPQPAGEVLSGQEN